ncbi:diphosphomevalonate decarboxylase [Lacticaseibacillus thailandensis]|uniref:diphosphomevalonate decarboxylase n=1 Tax=Lacticaseibacillus thailandensis DSM 22698 = JCM 13996 TaxID=1423810 RepID=A0A0R2C8W4_9LACO|nr:diphosphomevalonate decarboxylase [Lacticaseibacillus thailandensis]KRM88120.1 diphosphomevalonate decarboxylase [Lacticaseibacillus thailandensis DSM 22698 = JCM 13996]
MLKVTARAHTNIALIKYWGKADQQLILPANSSVSLTLDRFYADTTVGFTDQPGPDRFVLDGRLQDAAATHRVHAFLDLVRQQAHIHGAARVSSTNHVPNAAGLASSSSAFAALALAASRAAGLSLDPTALSRLARRGSGSATRSIFGGTVIWHRGTDDASSFAEPVTTAPNLDLRMVAILIDAQQKDVSSRNGMARTVATSPYFPVFTATAERDSQAMVAALAAGDLEQIGELTERSALMMHGATLAAQPPFTYFAPATLAAWAVVRAVRAGGLPAYVTMDAGPNVKVLTDATHVDAVVAGLRAQLDNELVVCAPGPAARILTTTEE